MQIFFIKKKSTSYHDADDPRNGEGMGGDWKRDTFQTPLISRSIPRSKVNRIFLGDKIYASLGNNKERRVQLTKLYE